MEPHALLEATSSVSQLKDGFLFGESCNRLEAAAM